jgi:hypothetical protein
MISKYKPGAGMMIATVRIVGMKLLRISKSASTYTSEYISLVLPAVNEIITRMDLFTRRGKMSSWIFYGRPSRKSAKMRVAERKYLTFLTTTSLTKIFIAMGTHSARRVSPKL